MGLTLSVLHNISHVVTRGGEDLQLSDELTTRKQIIINCSKFLSRNCCLLILLLSLLAWRVSGLRKCDFLWGCFGGSNEMFQINVVFNYIWLFVTYVWVFTVPVSYSSERNALIASKHTLTTKLTTFTHSNIVFLKWKSWASVYVCTTGYAFTARRIRTSKKH